MRSSYHKNLKTKESLQWFQESRNKWEQSKRRRVVALPPPLQPYSPMIEEENVHIPPQESSTSNLTLSIKNSNCHQDRKTQSPEEFQGQTHRDRLISFYQKYNPSKLDSVEATLEAFRGKEDLLFQKLEAKYLKVKAANPSAATPSPYLPPDGTRPICFLDFTWGDSQQPQRVVIQLFRDKAPLACENFRCLCTGELGTGRSGKPLCYRYSKIHRIVPKFCVQGGDFTKGDGTGGESIYQPNSENGDMWGKFRDETPFLQHSRKGLLSMANNGPNRNGSQFFFTLRPLSSLDGKHVVFGEVVEGMDIIDAIGALSTNEKQRPLESVVISDCGEIKPNGQEIKASGGEDRDKNVQNGFGGSQLFGSPSVSFGNAANFSSSSPFASSFGSSGGSSGFGTTRNAEMPTASIPDAEKDSSVVIQSSAVAQKFESGKLPIFTPNSFATIGSLSQEITNQSTGVELQTTLERHNVVGILKSSSVLISSSTSVPSTKNALLNDADQHGKVVNNNGRDKDPLPPLPLSPAKPSALSALPEKTSFRPLGDKLASLLGLSNSTDLLYISPTSVLAFPGLCNEPDECSLIASAEVTVVSADPTDRSKSMCNDGPCLQVEEVKNSLRLDWERRTTLTPKSCMSDCFPSDLRFDTREATHVATSSTRLVLDELEIQLTLYNEKGISVGLPHNLGWQIGLSKPKRLSNAACMVDMTRPHESRPRLRDVSIEDELGTLLAIVRLQDSYAKCPKNIVAKENFKSDQSETETSNERCICSKAEDIVSIQENSRQSYVRHISSKMRDDELSTTLVLMLASFPNTENEQQLVIRREEVRTQSIPLSKRPDKNAKLTANPLTKFAADLPFSGQEDIQVDELGICLKLSTNVCSNIGNRKGGQSLKESERPKMDLVATKCRTDGCLFMAKPSIRHCSADGLCVDERQTQLAIEFPYPLSSCVVLYNLTIALPRVKRECNTRSSTVNQKYRAQDVGVNGLPDELEIQLALSGLTTPTVGEVSAHFDPQLDGSPSAPPLQKLFVRPGSSRVGQSTTSVPLASAYKQSTSTSTSTGDLISLSCPTRTDQSATQSLPFRVMNGVGHKQLQMRLLTFAGKPKELVDTFEMSNHKCSPNRVESGDADSVGNCGSVVQSVEGLARGNLVCPRPQRKFLSLNRVGSDDDSFGLIPCQTSFADKIMTMQHKQYESSSATECGLSSSSSLLRIGSKKLNESAEPSWSFVEVESDMSKQVGETRNAAKQASETHQQLRSIQKVILIPSNKGLFSSVSAFSKPVSKPLTAEADGDDNRDDKFWSKGVSDLVTFFEGLTHEYLGDVDLVACETTAGKSFNNASPTAMDQKCCEFCCAPPGDLSMSPQQHSGFEEPAFFSFKDLRSTSDQPLEKGKGISYGATPDLVTTLSLEM